MRVPGAGFFRAKGEISRTREHMGGVRVFSSLGVGTQQSFIRGGSAPWSTLTTLYTILDRKGTLFLYLPLANGTPFKYLV